MSDAVETTETAPETTTPETQAPAKVPVAPEAKAETKPAAKPDRSILKLKDAPATGETTAATPEGEFVMPEKFKGKSAEEIAKAYVEKEKADSRKTTIPETYQFDALAEHGLAITDEAHGKEVTDMLKETGLTQEQLSKALPHWKKQQERTFKVGYERAIVDEFGGLPDLDAEVTKLRGVWGADFDKNLAELKEAYSDPDFANLMDRPLKWQARGYEIALAIRRQELGANFGTDSDVASGPSVIELRAELRKLTDDPAFGKHGSKSAALSEQANKIASQIARLEKRK